MRGPYRADMPLIATLLRRDVAPVSSKRPHTRALATTTHRATLERAIGAIGGTLRSDAAQRLARNSALTGELGQAFACAVATAHARGALSLSDAHLLLLPTGQPEARSRDRVQHAWAAANDELQTWLVGQPSCPGACVEARLRALLADPAAFAAPQHGRWLDLVRHQDLSLPLLEELWAHPALGWLRADVLWSPSTPVSVRRQWVRAFRAEATVLSFAQVYWTVCQWLRVGHERGGDQGTRLRLLEYSAMHRVELRYDTLAMRRLRARRGVRFVRDLPSPPVRGDDTAETDRQAHLRVCRQIFVALLPEVAAARREADALWRLLCAEERAEVRGGLQLLRSWVRSASRVPEEFPARAWLRPILSLADREARVEALALLGEITRKQLRHSDRRRRES